MDQKGKQLDPQRNDGGKDLNESVNAMNQNKTYELLQATNAGDLHAQNQSYNPLFNIPSSANDAMNGSKETLPTMPNALGQLSGNLGVGSTLAGIDLKSLGLGNLLPDVNQQQHASQMPNANSLSFQNIPGLPDNLLQNLQASGKIGGQTNGANSAATDLTNNLLQGGNNLNLQNILNNTSNQGNLASHSSTQASANLDVNKILQGLPGIESILGNTPNLPQNLTSQQGGLTLESHNSILNQIGMGGQASILPTLDGQTNMGNLGQLQGNSSIPGLSNLQLPSNLGAPNNNLQMMLQGMDGTQKDLPSQINLPNAGMPSNIQQLLGNVGMNVNLPQLGMQSSMPNMGGMGQMNRQGMGNVFIPGSAAHAHAFQVKGPDNEVKLFVGGLAFITQEADLINYFKQYGQVADAIVMRDRQTQRGRGFGFVKMLFESKEKASENKITLVEVNRRQGHVINDKIVDVKSADDYKKDPSQMQPAMNPLHSSGGQQMGMFNQNLVNRQMPGMQRATDGNPNLSQEHPIRQKPDHMSSVNKPNPYVIVQEDDGTQQQDIKQEDGQKKNYVFKYPKAKIFVGGLDFKLEQQDLIQHFEQFGEVDNAVILKDTYTKQSRGFGFVLFKEESVALNLIHNVKHTNIHGRKVDIKSAEPKQQSSQPTQPQYPPPRRPNHSSQYPQGKDKDYASIPAYGGSKDGDRQRSRDSRDDYDYGSQSSGRRNDYYRERRNYDERDRHSSKRDSRYEMDDYRDDERNGRRDRDRDRRRKRSPERRRRYSRSNSPNSSNSSSSYRRSRENRRSSGRKEKRRRGPHHGPHHDSKSEAPATTTTQTNSAVKEETNDKVKLEDKKDSSVNKEKE